MEAPPGRRHSTASMPASPERLHVTNGDAAAERILEAGVGGSVLPWRDVLHEGPVPAGLSLGDLTAVRAQFIGQAGWDDPEQVLPRLRWRDAMLSGFRAYAEVVLWFEHDLYDQLQLLQVLDWFTGVDPGPVRLSIINPGEFLGMQSPQRMRELFASRRSVTPEMLAPCLGRLAGIPGARPYRAGRARRHSSTGAAPSGPRAPATV